MSLAFLGAAPGPEEGPVWIGKSDNAKSCERGSGLPIDGMAAQLKRAGVKILAKKKVHDGKMRIQVCGADKGTLNAFRIARKDVSKTRDLGFAPVDRLR